MVNKFVLLPFFYSVWRKYSLHRETENLKVADVVLEQSLKMKKMQPRTLEAINWLETYLKA